MIVRIAVRDGEFAERVEDTACLRLSQREMRQDGNMVLEKGYKVCVCENKDFSISIVVNEKAGYSPSNSGCPIHFSCFLLHKSRHCAIKHSKWLIDYSWISI